MEKDVALEDSVMTNDGFIPRDVFMWRDTIPGVGLAFSCYRTTEEAYHFCGSLIKSVGEVPSRYPSDFRGLIRVTARCIEGLGIVSYNSGVVYLIGKVCDLVSN